MDGSAAPFVDLINSVGIIEQEAPRHFLMIKERTESDSGRRGGDFKPFSGSKPRIRLRQTILFIINIPKWRA